MATSSAPWANFATTAMNKFSMFYQALAAPHIDTPLPPTSILPPPPSIPNIQLSTNTTVAVSRTPYSTVHKPSQHPLDAHLYEPEGRWAFMKGRGFYNAMPVQELKASTNYNMSIYKAKLVADDVHLWVKTWTRDKDWKGFFSELYLFKTQLRPLQGIIVPNVISVVSSLYGTHVVMEPPHASFWITASPDMPHALKWRVVRAYELLHARGIAQTSVALEHMLIGADGRVTLAHFHHARGAVAHKPVDLRAASAKDLRLEMRRVKYLLDFEDARDVEEEKYARGRARHARNQDELSRAQMDYTHKPCIDRGSKDDRQNPPFETDSFQRMKAALRAYTPRRVVMPGQSAEDLARHVARFCEIVDGMDAEDESYLNAPQPPLPFSLPAPPLFPGTTTRKRKDGPEGSSSPAQKRLRPDMPPPPMLAGPSSQPIASSSRAGPSSLRGSSQPVASSSRAGSSTGTLKPKTKSNAGRTRPVKKAASSPNMLPPPLPTSLTADNLALLPGATTRRIPVEDTLSTVAHDNYAPNPYGLVWQAFDRERSPSDDGEEDPSQGASGGSQGPSGGSPPGSQGSQGSHGSILYSPQGSLGGSWTRARVLERHMSAPEIRAMEREEEREVERMLGTYSEGTLTRMTRDFFGFVGRYMHERRQSGRR
ncbi:hypothetical protein K525DRAFT_203959 [Schizophyllum commune Loenen D]|nr:hypothetical protein K525DRAFT_203959 [Schizophyllum commune Loenen D]